MKHFTLCALAFTLSFGAFAQLINPGFESGLGVGWTESSTNFGSPLCTVADCGNCTGICVPQAGDWFVWFGGAGANPEQGAISQVVTIPNGNAATITFWVRVAPFGDLDPATTDQVKVELDGTTLFTTSAADSLLYANYTQKTLNISNYTNGGPHVFGVVGNQTGGSNILFDSFSMQVDGNISVGFDELLNQEKPFVLYPNPANRVINLQFGQRLEGNATVRILDMNGRLIHEEKMTEITNKTYTLDTQSFATGLYTMEVINGKEQLRERFSVAH
jgi:hypothetical protein